MFSIDSTVVVMNGKAQQWGAALWMLEEPSMKSAARLQAAVFLWAGVNWVNFRQVELVNIKGIIPQNHETFHEDLGAPSRRPS